jgi:hypothetical protein
VLQAIVARDARFSIERSSGTAVLAFSQAGRGQVAAASAS